MKRTLAILSLTLAAFAFVQPAVAADKLDRKMKDLNRTTRDLKKVGEKWDDGVELAKKAIQQTREATNIPPDSIARIRDDQSRELAMEDYKKRMEDLVKAFAAIEAACMEKDAAKFTAAFENLDKVKKEGHEKYELD
jgi:hypothetical protein